MASSSSGLIWTGEGFVPAGSIAAANFRATPTPSPAPSPAQVPQPVPRPQQAVPVPAPAPKASVLAPITAPAVKPTPSPAPAPESPGPTDYSYRDFASGIAGSLNAQMGGSEYVETVNDNGSVLLELNPGMSATPYLEAELAREVAKGSQMYPGATAVKISGTEYRISPRALSQPATAPPLAASTSGQSTSGNIFSPDWASAFRNKPTSAGASTATSPLASASTTEDIVTPTILYNREVQIVNALYQKAGIPIQYDQATLPQGEATALAYSREASAFNKGLPEVNAALKAFGAPTVSPLPSWSNLNKSQTGFEGFVEKIDTGWYNNPILGPLFKDADTLSANAVNDFEQGFLYKIGGQNIVTDMIGNFGGGGAAAIAETPKFILELGTRSPIGASVYAMTGGSKDAVGDIGNFYLNQGWLLAGGAGAAVITAGLSASLGNIEAVTNPLARLAGGMFVMSVLTNPKFTPDEMQYVKPGTITVDSSGTLKVSSGEWMKVPTDAEQAEVEAKLAANPLKLDLTEAQKTKVEEAIDASERAARTSRIQQMISDNNIGGNNIGGDSGVSDAWAKATAKIFPDERIAERISKLQTGPNAWAYNPDLTIEPIMGPISKIVETDEGDVVATMQLSGAKLYGNPQYLMSVALAPPTVVGEAAGIASLVSAVSLASGLSVVSSAQLGTLATISSDLQSTRLLSRNITGTATGTMNAAQTLTSTLTGTLTQTGTLTGTLTQTGTLTGTLTRTATLTKTVTNQPTALPPLIAQSTLEKKRRKPMAPKLPSIRRGGKSTIRSDLISSGISQFKYGKATSPTPTESIYRRFAVGGVIPTVEMRKDKGKQKIPSLIKGIRGLFKRGKP